MKRLCLILITTIAAASSCIAKKYIPQEGDLLFQVAGSSKFSEAIADGTAWGDSIKFVHVAIVAMDKGKPYVIEASSKKGVTHTAWKKFLSSSPSINHHPGVVAMRAKAAFPIAKAIERANGFLGEKYDWSYYPDNGKIYCSELVYESYRKYDGSPLFTASPMNFRDERGNMPIFWINLFKRLGEPIPEGVLGTNPNDMAKDPILVEVYRFF